MAQATPQLLRRAVARAGSGKAVSLDETEALLSARGPTSIAHGLAAASAISVTGTPSRTPARSSSRSPCSAATTVHYCTFAKPPAKLDHPFLTPDEVVAIADAGRRWAARKRCSRSATGRRSGTSGAAVVGERGYGSTLGYLRAVAIRVIEETGLLPHLNPGVMSTRSSRG
jgi:FO synthase